MGVAIQSPMQKADVTCVDHGAIKDRGDYVIKRNKIFITNATLADFLIVLCVTNPDHPKSTKVSHHSCGDEPPRL